MATAEVIELHNKNNMSVEECLKLCLRNADNYHQILVIGWGKDGEFFHHSSDINKADANWLIDAAKQDVLTGETTISCSISEQVEEN